MLTTDFQSLIHIDYLPGAVSLDTGQALRDFVEEKISHKIFNIDVRDLTLGHLYKKRQTLLRISVLNLQTGKSELLDGVSCPHVKVMDAIMASVALPPIFPPVIIDDTLYADAGLVDYFPICLGTENIEDLDTVLGMRLRAVIDLSTIRDDLQKSMFPFAVYMKHMYEVTSAPLYESNWSLIPKKLQDQTITILTPEANMLEAGLNPSLIQQVKLAMIDAGIRSIK
jgi:predicted acylesterase/phospholipase RssA